MIRNVSEEITTSAKLEKYLPEEIWLVLVFINNGQTDMFRPMTSTS
jgi:hypothetical protein